LCATAAQVGRGKFFQSYAAFTSEPLTGSVSSQVFLGGNVAFDFTESNVGSSDKLPEMDLAYLGGNGYTAVSELMRAMILRTIEDLQSGSELREEALEYLMSDDDEYILSFISICRYFGFDPEKTRYAILNAKSRIRTRRRAA
jgi:hypothetical protein